MRKEFSSSELFGLGTVNPPALEGTRAKKLLPER